MASCKIIGIWAASLAATTGQGCFILRQGPPPEELLNASVVALLRSRFLANLNVQGTGAVIASTGAVPALDDACNGGCPGGYTFHWTRDGALSMLALSDFLVSPLAQGRRDSDLLNTIFRAYTNWVGRLQNETAHRHGEDASREPKWNLSTGTPYEGGWCRPQNDGPGLEAQALMAFAKRVQEPAEQARLWALIRFDLDWLAQEGSPSQNTCDLWEETRDRNLFWNRMTMRTALLAGSRLARLMGHEELAEAYRGAGKALGNPARDHLQAGTFGGCYFTECPPHGAKNDCRDKGKDVDGAVILTLIHGWRAASTAGSPPMLLPTAAVVAHTVKSYNDVFCTLYPVNLADSRSNIPGVLYGRYAKDAYGGGPWLLISAALASLFYQAANVTATGRRLNTEEVHAWSVALESSNFNGTPSEFISAGDSVLMRLWHHVRPDDEGHLYEQINKVTGEQYNAKDLTWSYAEVLSALVERRRVWPCRGCHVGGPCEQECLAAATPRPDAELTCPRDAVWPDGHLGPPAGPSNWLRLFGLGLGLGVILGVGGTLCLKYGHRGLSETDSDDEDDFSEDDEKF